MPRVWRSMVFWMLDFCGCWLSFWVNMYELGKAFEKFMWTFLLCPKISRQFDFFCVPKLSKKISYCFFLCPKITSKNSFSQILYSKITRKIWFPILFLNTTNKLLIFHCQIQSNNDIKSVCWFSSFLCPNFHTLSIKPNTLKPQKISHILSIVQKLKKFHFSLCLNSRSSLYS